MPLDRSPASYRSRAIRFAYRWPVLTALGTQVNFWIATNTVLVCVNQLVVRAAAATYDNGMEPPPFFMVWTMGMLTAIVYGSTLGFIDLWMDRRFGAGTSVGRRILIKGLLYTCAFVVISTLTVLCFDYLVAKDWLARVGVSMTNEARFAWALTFIPTTLAGNFLISFIKQMNRSFGPGVVIALLFGSYQKPVRERRIFMFMDLYDSTTHAENLGPERYSAMIRDLFHDVDTVVPGFEAEIYQHVGDEVVFAWNEPALRDKRKCLLFYFAVQRAIAARGEHYRNEYGVLPAFKAGLHVGEVIAVEVGDIKREIAYHGDTINTAARIQATCKELGRSLLASADLVRLCDLNERSLLRAEALGSVLLKGKNAYIDICAVEEGTWSQRTAGSTNGSHPVEQPEPRIQ